MTQWMWLTNPEQPYTWGVIFRIVIKAGVLFVLCNLLWAMTNPLPFLSQFSLYNTVVSGRERLPFGENARAYNLSLNNLDAMFASHSISQPKGEDEFRVMVIGDSSVWGILLENDDTLTGYLNTMALSTDDGRQVRSYNLGHPILSLTKDLLILDRAMDYQPDMVIWLTTLRSFPRDKQTFPPIVHNNAKAVRELIETYDLNLNPADETFVELTLWDGTIIGQRRELADWLHLQLYGIMWQSTGIDQVYPETYDLRSEDFDTDMSWGGYDEPTNLTEDDLAFDVIRAGFELVGEIPLLLVNEPIFVSEGENSDLHYNAWYPRWAFDSYRALYTDLAESEGWQLLDVWDGIAGDEFTDSPVHLTPTGSQQLAKTIAETLLSLLKES